jgi:hypothetical protein
MADTEIDWIARSGKKAKGKRPKYFSAPEHDRMLSIIMALVGEVSVIRERLDTVERLLETKGTINRADIENYAPDSGAAFERGLITREYIARVMRALQQELEAEIEEEPSLEQISKNLRDM